MIIGDNPKVRVLINVKIWGQEDRFKLGFNM